MSEEREQRFYSPQEHQFLIWCSEAEQKGLIDTFSNESFTIEIAPANKFLKVRACTYTSDFTIKFSDTIPKEKIPNTNFYELKINNYIFVVDEQNVAQIDVKALSGSMVVNNSDVSFPIVMKVILDKYDVFINKLEVLSLFYYTFIPEELVLTEKTKKVKVWFSQKFKPCKNESRIPVSKQNKGNRSSRKRKD